MPSAGSTALSGARCRFGEFVLQPGERRLLAAGKPVALGARAFDLLLALVARTGQLVSKHELLELVWPGLVVEENNLQVQVSTLRKLLGATALSTIPGRGYRFELPVETMEGEPGKPPAQDANAATIASPAGALAGTETPPAAARAPTNIPPRLPTLYGRAQDVAEIKHLLSRNAVVTIVGAGGIGKTLLAQTVAGQLALECAADYPDGVWWVELAPIADGALVPSAVARVLQTQSGGDRSPTDTIAAVLAAQRSLLVLDNCEHLIEHAAAFVDAVSAAAPGLRVLVTSQETLKCANEQIFRLGALATAPADATTDAIEVGSVELFVVRARAVDPRFSLTPENTPSVLEICRRLDGIPLAIELAAARVPLLGVEGLRARLDERFSVLTAGARMVLRRHQTLRATLEWSHGLLNDQEQQVFRRLGVFAGSFTLEAAQHVAADDEIDRWAALDHLGALVDKSLVLAEGHPVPRYRLLETTRAYALERAGEAGETSRLLRRHAEALLQHLSAIEQEIELQGPSVNSAAKAAPELDNLRAALAWLPTADDCDELAISLAGNSLRVWRATVLLNEGLERCLALRTRVHNGLPLAVTARFWLTIGGLGLYGTRRDAYDASHQAAQLYRALGDAGHLFEALVMIAVLGVRFGTTDDMGRAVAEAERLLRPEWPALQRARLEFARSRWLARQNRIEESLAAAQKQVSICEEDGNVRGIHYAMSNVVAAELQLGRFAIALGHARASIAALDAVGGGAGAGHLWLAVVHAELLLGHLDAALAAARTAYTLLLREGDEMRLFLGLALCAFFKGRPDDAARIAGYAEGVQARAGTVREAHWSSIGDRLRAALDAAFTADELARLKAEGAALREDRAVRLALSDAA